MAQGWRSGKGQDTEIHAGHRLVQTCAHAEMTQTLLIALHWGETGISQGVLRPSSWARAGARGSVSAPAL